MIPNLTAQNLSERLHQKMKTDRQQIETLTASELAQLTKHLKCVANNALTTIERDICERIDVLSQTLITSVKSSEKHADLLRWTIRRTSLYPFIIGIALFTGICIGSWGLMRYWTYQIQNQMDTHRALASQIERQRETLSQIERQTWGLRLIQEKNGRFIVLPKRARIETGWTIGAKKAIRVRYGSTR